MKPFVPALNSSSSLLFAESMRSRSGVPHLAALTGLLTLIAK